MATRAEGEDKKYHLIPTEIIEAWAKGEYYNGDAPSLSYKQMGTALKLRGWYTYDACEPDPAKPDFKGVAKIELKGQSLLLSGIRLCGPKGHGEGVEAVRFWRSQYSFFYTEKEIMWVYYVYPGVDDEAILTSYLGPLDTFPAVQEKTARDRFGFEEKRWSTLLQKLRTSFDTDIMQIEDSCDNDAIDKVLLHYNIEDSKGEYRALYPRTDEHILAGITCFQKEPQGTDRGGLRP
jgi:hypothetical protein